MKENYLFRKTPEPVAYETQLPAVYPVPPVPAVVQAPIHKPSLVLGILALVLSVWMPLVALILGVIGRVLGENHSWHYSIAGGKICCNVAFILAGLCCLLTFLQQLLVFM